LCLFFIECEPCNKPGHACDIASGRCVCPFQTEGFHCEHCVSGSWNYHPFTGCQVSSVCWSNEDKFRLFSFYQFSNYNIDCLRIVFAISKEVRVTIVTLSVDSVIAASVTVAKNVVNALPVTSASPNVDHVHVMLLVVIQKHVLVIAVCAIVKGNVIVK